MKKPSFLIALLALAAFATFFFLKDSPPSSIANREHSKLPAPSNRDSTALLPAAVESIPVAAESSPPAHPEGCDCPAHRAVAVKPVRDANKVVALPDTAGFFKIVLSEDRKVAKIPLPGGRIVAGDVTLSRNNDAGQWLVQGTMKEPEPGRFMFMQQSIKGVAGDMVGFVLYDKSDVAYKVLPEGEDGAPVLVEVTAGEVICRGYQAMPQENMEEPQHLPQTHPQTYPIPPGENNIVQLQSLPGADGVLYLDFDGEERDFVAWGYINAAPSGANNNQIFDVWKGVSEDFQPFNLNVTTIRSVYDAAPSGQRMHVIITPTDDAARGAGGVAYLNSFNWDEEIVCWAFILTGKNAVEVVSHEIGHTVGLYHHGRISPAEEYYRGINGWAPIMGVGYYHPLSHWSRAEYPSANNTTQNDLLVITTENNGIAYRVDDHAATYAAASELEISLGGGVSNEGIIERTSEQDAFRFKTSGGRVLLTINGVNFNPNLDVRVQLLEQNGTVLVTHSPDNLITATIDRVVPAGNYYVLVTGSGKGNPASDGYSAYGSLGGYTITGNVAGGVHSDRFSIAENSANGSSVGTSAARVSHGAGVLTYSINSGNSGGAFAINPTTGAITVANASALDYEALASRWDDPATFALTIGITDSLAVTTESIRTIISVLDVNEAPVINPIAAITIPESLRIGTKIATVTAVDPDPYDYATFSIVGGNPGNAFSINSLGEITVSGALEYQTRPSYSLVVQASDKLTPVNEVTTTIEINLVEIVDGYAPGSILRTVYDNIFGTTVAALTSNIAYPDDFSSKEFLTSFDAGLDRGDLFGATLRGYLVAPATGDYTFWIASNDASQLWISTDASLDNVVLRASVSPRTARYDWDQNPSQQSVTLPLVQGQIYYIESLHKAQFDEDHLAVAWSGPGIEREVIPATWLAPFDALPEVIISSPSDEYVDIPANVGLMLECVATAPNGIIPTVLWSQVSGPAAAIFESPDQTKTAVHFTVNGVYDLRVSATDGVNTATDEIRIRVGSTIGTGLRHTRYGVATTGSYSVDGETGYTITGASIGIPLIDKDDGFQLLGQVFQGDFDITARVARGSNVAANHERLGLIVRKGTAPISNGISSYIGYRTSTNWGHYIRRQIAGEANQQNSYENTGTPGYVRISRQGNTVRTYHSYTSGQTWVFRGAIAIAGPVRAGLCWSSSNKAQTGFASFDNIKGFAPTNLAPLVNAGADQTVEANMSIALNGSVSDDGLPSAGGGLYTRWTRVSGPGTVTFSDPETLNSTVSCDTEGTHVLRLTADDGGAKSYDDMVLTVTAPLAPLPAFAAPVLAGFKAPAGVSYDGFSLASQVVIAAPSASGPNSAAGTSHPFVFTKISGPAWLTVGSDGQLSGAPRLADGGSNSFVVQVSNSLGQSSQATLQIDVTLTPWQGWTVAKFGEQAENPQIAGDSVDKDKDGHVNLMEYALGTDPETPDLPSITHDRVLDGGQSFLCITIDRDPAATDVQYVVEVTSTPGQPGSWTSEETFIEANTNDKLIVRDTVGGAMRFIRLKVIK